MEALAGKDPLDFSGGYLMAEKARDLVNIRLNSEFPELNANQKLDMAIACIAEEIISNSCYNETSRAEQSMDPILQKKEIDLLRLNLIEGGYGDDSGFDNEGEEPNNDSAVSCFLKDFHSDFHRENLIIVPREIFENSEFIGEVSGISRPEYGKYYILETDVLQFKLNGIILSAETKRKVDRSGARLIGYDFFGWHTGEEWMFIACDTGEFLYPQRFDLVTKLFSRNTGLLESSTMLSKCAIIVGCGSVGSLFAMELARCGVGSFVLIDTDKLEIHNICRHQCGFDDIGRYKVDAVADKVRNINPYAKIQVYRSIVQDVHEDELKTYVGSDSIIIGCGDNRGSSAWLNNLAFRTNTPFIATTCWTRAYAGEVFYWLPGGSTPCYSCGFGGLISNDRPDSHANYFGEEEDMIKVNFEPGVSVDLDFVTTIALKTALDILNIGNTNYTPRVLKHLTYYTLICNTNESKIGGEMAPGFPHPLFISNNVVLKKKSGCPICDPDCRDNQ